MQDFGASFSVKYAREMGVDPQACLTDALKDLGVRRLRLMSYWDVHEPVQGVYDFAELDWQFDLAKEYGAQISLAIGLRQPRWPESHWPVWARQLPANDWHTALRDFIRAVVERYKDHPCLHSWQLENEALLKTFGQDGDFDRTRLIREYALVKSLDRNRSIIMSTSNSWGLPFRHPHADMYAFSIYRYFYDKGKYRHSRRSPLFYKLRAALIRVLTGKAVFIHELQTEPWGPTGTIHLSVDEQMISMSLEHFKEAIIYAKQTKLLPADLWGLEWWYWLKTVHNNKSFWHEAQQLFRNNV